MTRDGCDSRRGKRLGCAFATALAVTISASRAGAHGGFPRAFEIITEPGNPKDVVLRSDLWGFFRTLDGGKTWQWTCAEVYGSDSLGVSHVNMLLLPGGRLLVANPSKGLYITDDFCNWKQAAELGGELVYDVALSSGSVFVLTSTYKMTGVVGGLWQSTNNGDTLARVGGLLPSTFGASSLEFSTSNPERVYVLGQIIEATTGTIQRSDDGGATWTAFAVPIVNPVPDDLMHLRIAAVHPTRPDVVFVWADLEEGFGVDQPDQLWATQDGGKSWSEVYGARGDLPGLAFSPDGTELLVAGPKEGVQRANLDEALAKGQSAFTQQFDRQVWGLRWTDTGLTAGTDNFTAAGIPAFTYGASSDEGKSFEKLMSVCEVKYDACSEPSSLRSACDNVYSSPLGGFVQDYTDGPRCLTKGGGTDGGRADGGAEDVRAIPSSKKADGGCACALSAADGSRSRVATVGALAACASALRSLRRKRR
jgi:hypothetical protein